MPTDGPISRGTFPRNEAAKFKGLVSIRLRAAGFKRSTSTARDVFGGWKVTQGSHGSRAVSVTWVEGLDESIARMHRMGAPTLADIGNAPEAADHLAAYADFLREHFTVEFSENGRYLDVTPATTPPRRRKGRTPARTVRGILVFQARMCFDFLAPLMREQVTINGAASLDTRELTDAQVTTLLAAIGDATYLGGTYTAEEGPDGRTWADSRAIDGARVIAEVRALKKGGFWLFGDINTLFAAPKKGSGVTWRRYTRTKEN